MAGSYSVLFRRIAICRSPPLRAARAASLAPGGSLVQ
jgi:hypothetical protein